MATATYTTSRFHNLSDNVLADEIGRVDTILKSAEAELKALKDEFKTRELTAVSGGLYSVTATEQIAGRLNVQAVKAFLGENYAKFETVVVSTVVRIKPLAQPLDVVLAA